MVYFLQRLGLVRSYVFDLYTHSPYSAQLADDYMWLAKKGDEYISNLASNCDYHELDKWLRRH
ncbi:hypothetical protein [Pyrobaculum aerophilum]|uniref:hypothetical protein n=1 Tax=Pyrobaculum aerophilum TaxID=13773 RepID=UPI0023F4A6FB|nr:hypothetical protein [Pyrobaculum aerophilum]MCX8137402.1 hypothetical protein [Pyrobaculum aerophilum]